MAFDQMMKKLLCMAMAAALLCGILGWAAAEEDTVYTIENIREFIVGADEPVTLPDGNYDAKVIVESISPMTFLFV